MNRTLKPHKTMKMQLKGTIEIEGVNGETWFIEANSNNEYRVSSSLGYDTLNGDTNITSLFYSISYTKERIKESEKEFNAGKVKLRVERSWIIDTIENHASNLIDLSMVHRLYPGGVINELDSFWVDGKGWFKNDELGHYRNVKEAIIRAIQLNAQVINLCILHEGVMRFPDYQIKELLTKKVTLPNGVILQK